MRKHAEFPGGRLIEIRIQGCTLVLGEAELLRLLNQDQGLWAEALKRGKAVLRGRRAAGRDNKGGNETWRPAG